MPERHLSRDNGMLPAVALTAAAGLSVCAAAVFLSGAASAAAVAGALYTLIALIALPAFARQRPRPPFGAANSVTLIRSAIIAVLLGLAVDPPAIPVLWWAAAAMAAVALSLDALDGWLARQAGRSSAFGARFDMEIDALAALVLSILLWRADKSGSWVLAIGAMRYAFVLAGWPVPWMRRPLPPSRRRRAACMAQGVLLLLCLLPIWPASLPGTLAAAALAVTAASFAADTYWLARRRATVA